MASTESAGIAVKSGDMLGSLEARMARRTLTAPIGGPAIANKLAVHAKCRAFVWFALLFSTVIEISFSVRQTVLSNTAAGVLAQDVA